MMWKSTARLAAGLGALALAAAAAGLALAGTTGEQTAASGEEEVAIFAGGCFWCVESDFDAVPGVLRTVSGYTGGTTDNPTYKEVTYGRTGHREAVEITFDPKRVTYAELIEVFWRSVDPTDGGGQFCDRGESYETAIFARTNEQRAIAQASKQRLAASGKLGKSVVTPIEAAGRFYPAEDYHQDFYTKSPVRYHAYRFGCGRDGRIKDLWGDEAHRGIEKH